MTLLTDSGAISSAASKRPASHRNSTTGTTTPPRVLERGRLDTRTGEDASCLRRPHLSRHSESGRSIVTFDAEALDHALLREHARQQRESTPGGSPHRKRQRINGDRFVSPVHSPVWVIRLNFSRFIPSRSGQDLQASFSLLHEDGSPATPSKQKKRTPHGELHFQKSTSALISRNTECALIRL